MSNPPKCRLCGERDDLRRSHIFPAGVFRRLRNPSSSNPNPIHITRKGVAASSRQPTAFLLCGACEQRLNVHGESYVESICWQREGKFPLLELLQSGPHFRLESGLVVCMAKEIPRIDIRRLVYFAASIFWRASVYRRSFEDSVNRVDLGERYREEFRKYLLGDSDFPQNAALMVSVSPAPRASQSACYPSGQRFRGAHAWRFTIPGVAFDLFLGKLMPKPIRKMCILRSPRNLIFITEKVDERLAEAIVELARKAIRSSPRAAIVLGIKAE